MEIVQIRFELLIKGGEIADAPSGYSGRMGVAIKYSRIAAGDHDIAANSPFNVSIPADSW